MRIVADMEMAAGRVLARVICLGSALALAGALPQLVHGSPPPVFHLDFSVADDVTGNMATEWGDQVKLVAGAGPVVGGANLDAGRWAGAEAAPPGIARPGRLSRQADLGRGGFEGGVVHLAPAGVGGQTREAARERRGGLLVAGAEQAPGCERPLPQVHAQHEA